jgi:hypothetical protein
LFTKKESIWKISGVAEVGLVSLIPKAFVGVDNNGMERRWFHLIQRLMTPRKTSKLLTF